MATRRTNRLRIHPTLEALDERTVPALFTPLPATADGTAGSLRDAIIQANTSTGNDVILLRPGTYSLSVLNLNNATANNLQENASATGDLDITQANRTIVIQGQGAGVTILDATGLNDRVLHILTNARLELRGLTIRGGVALEQGTPGTQNGAARGGGIFNAGGELVMDHVLVAGNQALGRPNTASNAEGAGIHSTGSLFMNACTIRNNLAVGSAGLPGSFSSSFDQFIDVPGGQGLAGGLLVTSNSAAVVMNSTISGNRAIGGTGGVGGVGQADFQGGVGGPGGEGGAGRGGGIGIRNGSTLTLINSTVSGNRGRGGVGGAGGAGVNGAAQGAGGNGGNGEGGGISIDASRLDIFNSTVAFNTTGTSAGGVGGTAGVFGLTLGGGVCVIDNAIGTFTSRSSLFANNIAGTGTDVSGAFDVAVRSLIQTRAGAQGIAHNDANGNRANVPALLAALANNGGPTQTHALLAGSAAIDGGTNPFGLALDQRGAGFARVKGVAIDIGAFER
jgi:hypothetical protein